MARAGHAKALSWSRRRRLLTASSSSGSHLDGRNSGALYFAPLRRARRPRLAAAAAWADAPKNQSIWRRHHHHHHHHQRCRHQRIPRCSQTRGRYGRRFEERRYGVRWPSLPKRTAARKRVESRDVCCCHLGLPTGVISANAANMSRTKTTVSAL